ncbi:MAG TPA: radical SAM protein [Candidatus Thermoplasmatota archaeon]|nr:radical SAM protein [Candidatus Thermoplasmatota archaeon]
MPADYRNDAVHPTLSRAHSLQQATLDGQGRGRDKYGACAVLESDGGGGLTDFTMGDTVTGEAWSVNPYSGCAHACSYCYVPDTVKAERVRWGRYVIVKRDLPTQLARAVGKSDKHTVYFSTATDPYQPAEREHRITRKCLEVLVRKDWPVEVLIRSPLVLRDLELLSQFSQVRVGLSIPTLDDRLRRALEPNAPPIEARLRTLKKVSDAGIKAFANYTPAAPPTTHDAAAIADGFLDAGAHWVNSKGLQRRHQVLGPMWERLRGTEWEDVTRFYSSRPRQAAWQEDLGAAFRKVGLPLSTPFFNPPFEWLQAPAPGPQQTRIDEVRVVVAPRPIGMPLPVIRVRR